LQQGLVDPSFANPPFVNPFAGRDVNWLLDTRAEHRRDHPFLIWEPFGGERRVWTYGEFRADVLRVAAGLAARGVKAGDKLLVHLDNCPEMELLWFACARIGAVIVTTNTRSSDDELAYYAEHCGAVAAVTQADLAAQVARACNGLRWLVVTERVADGSPAPAALAPDAASSFATLAGDVAALPALKPDPWRHGSVQYTSGTTSRPKGVLWTQGNALWGARQSAVHQGLVPGDVHLVMMPSFHTNARTYSILCSMWAGGSVVLMPRFSASRYWDVALRNRCTWASMLPFFCKALMQHPMPREHHFRMFGMNANEQPFDAAFGVRSIGWWGMTETVTQGLIGDHMMRNRPMSTGRPAAGYEVRILRDDQTTHVEPGEIGHLQIRGTRGIQLFLEYLNNPKATADSFTADGWFITGDRVRFDEDGWVTFADRDKDMLKVGAENVAASEIERVIAGVPGVYEVAVVAQKHRMLDEVAAAFVIPTADVSASGHDALREAILAACREKLADFKVPRTVMVVESMPRSTLEKVHKGQLRAGLPEVG
jgi:crotonobetaine/carnitine-CoA ligase